MRGYPGGAGCWGIMEVQGTGLFQKCRVQGYPRGAGCGDILEVHGTGVSQRCTVQGYPGDEGSGGIFIINCARVFITININVVRFNRRVLLLRYLLKY